MIGFGSDDQFAIKYRNLERTTLITLVATLYDKNAFCCEQ